MFRFDVCVVGGCGRVGLPLAIAFADKGLNVVVHDEKRDVRKIVELLKKNEINVMDRRTVTPSLENVFISLLSGQGVGQLVEGGQAA